MAQIKLHDQRKPLELWKLIGRCTVSCISVLFSQLALSLVPRFFSASPLFIQLILSAVSCLMDIAFNGAITMLIIGLCRYWSHQQVSYVMNAQLKRVRYCRICKGYIKGFDHHCPAFGNCIGQNNHVLFMVLLVGFLSTEASYVVCSSQFAAKSQIVDRTRLETSLSGNLAISTMLFSIFQLLWQAVFMTWHIYCICFNIRTDEWINWEKYPEFQDVVHSQQGQSFNEMRFKNPYDKGILQNVKEFLGF
ncbi:hypothetical protein RGQ29_000605 [Quercus rubra]|uniref:S-acyltransferase n=1 Tax=Quercus rubra TaxID=3512 RepID=A0AAN7GAN2_QUERU|nr:hypothetical protein RGQ29_000605 [Quercus rubra]